MNIIYNKNDKILSKIAEKFQKRLKADVEITLEIDEALDEFCGEIKDGTIKAGSYHQLLDTAGRFLRNPNASGTFKSYKKMPGMYFASHFNNYYDAAPLEEVYEYIDDLAFWGMGVLGFWFDMHHYKSMKDGEKQSSRLLAMLSYANSIGVKTSMTMLANEAFDNSPTELRADWTSGHDGYIRDLNDHYHLEICPSVEGGLQKIVEYRREMMEVFKKAQIDYILIGAYDQGGCTCPKCAPWGGNGFVKCCEAIIPLIREYFPNSKYILSLWQFGSFTGNTVEFEMLNEKMNAGALPEVSYMMSEPSNNSYAFTHDMARPVVGFPEISMCSTSPWGGYGANPRPDRWQKLWDTNRDRLDGGQPYSEGIYEDINKIIHLRFYRDNQDARTTVKEYLKYEFSLRDDLLDEVTQAIFDMDETLYRKFSRLYVTDEKGVLIKNPNMQFPPHYYEIYTPDKVASIEETIMKADATLTPEIRAKTKWQLIYLRAVIDGELLRNKFYRNEKVLEYFYKLIEISHLESSGVYTKPDVTE